eukprot:TRINITY_DN9476_c0_g1_i1.p1 TRINITY_DN9476_c0_g1~~TRINITY_DN9476_c0_g1_i1.p1  ORF type:complete len:551 (-),score=86.21 TRINITY_DN9476_c0_g1_i1:388-2040(-)
MSGFVIGTMKVTVPVIGGGFRDSGCRLEAATVHESVATLLSDLRVYSAACVEDDESDAENQMEERKSEVIMDSVRTLLHALGEDVSRDGLKRTPLRVAKALNDATRGYRQTVKDVVGTGIFTESGMDTAAGCGGGNGGLVVVRNIDHFSSCEACLLPFKVRFHIGYVASNQRVIGLSKLSRIAEVFAKRLQSPHKLVYDVSKALHDTIRPLGVAVLLECWHIPCPGLEANAAQSESSSVDMPGWMKHSVHQGIGVFEHGTGDFWNEFISVLKLRGIEATKSFCVGSRFQKRSWCPFHAIDDLYHLLTDSTSDKHKMIYHHHIAKPSSVNILPNLKPLTKSTASYMEMMAATEAIILALGEDFSNEELQLTPFRFAWWLLTFSKTNAALQPDYHISKNEATQKLRGHPMNQVMQTKDLSCQFLSEIGIPFFSQCEHHLLPFFGYAHIAYFPVDGAVHVDRADITSIVQFFSQRLQVQERLTKQIAEMVYSVCNATGVIVVLEASHICMMARGIEKMGNDTATTATLGRFLTESSAKASFFENISNRTTLRR